jgi:hypothetical protein
MLDDAQAWALYSGWTLPAESYLWWVHPNGNDAGRVAQYAEDLGLPVFESRAAAAEAAREQDDGDTIERTSLPDEFDFGDLVHEALFGPVFGHYFFEWAGDVRAGRWRITELAPLHPSTIGDIRSRRDGSLEWVRQAEGARAGLLGGFVEAVDDDSRIGAERLVPFVWWPDAQLRWLGRSMFRPLYRPWLCKDVLIRVDVTNHERAGGVPWIETDERYQGQSLEDLQRLAAEFRVDEEGGAALPPGALLRLAKIAGTDVIGSIRYHDEQMAVAWHAMVRMLGQTPNGSRALGGTFADLETLARRGLAEWVRRTVNRWVASRYWLWNWGDRQPPVLRFTPPELEAEAGANRTVPPVAEPTPEEPDPEVDPAGGSPPNPPPAATARPSPRLTAAAAAPDSAPGDDLTGGAFSRSRLPDRELRRQPYAHEVAAAVDFAALEVAYEDAADTLDALFLQTWLPEQSAALADSIVYTRAGRARTRVTAADMARITAPVVGADDLADVLHAVAVQGAGEAVSELAAQGVSLTAPEADALRALVTDHATAVATQTADGLSLAASRRAVQLAGTGLTPAELAAEVVGYLDGLAHTWERDQLAGAASQALNAGRLHVFERVEPTTAFYASELLDAATCSACIDADGREYATIAEARADYPSGGYRECAGGPRCRGTIVAVAEAETAPGSGTVDGVPV